MSENVHSSRILTVPNLLTFMRMALIPLFASLLYYGRSEWALAVFLVAGISDGVDGFLARRFKQESELGTIMDPIADKLLMTVAFIVLTLPNVLPPTRHLPIPFWGRTLSACHRPERRRRSIFLLWRSERQEAPARP